MTIARVGMGQRGYWQMSDASAVPAADAHAALAAEAYRVLVGVAGAYHAVITYKELAEEVLEASGLGTSVPYRYWIGGVLGRVVREAHRRGDRR